jgi:tRNA A-37 threonylcarbamoyl transferase component Bud32
VGQVLCDRYRVTREIGSGGFGTVYLAQDEKLVSKPVVVKVLNHLTADTWAVRKFHQEIEALARIDHPGVVAVLDEGQTPEGAPFLVMQFIDGVTLRKLIKPGGMDLHSAAAILRQIGSALGAAHEKGVFHRDLKPENIMVQTPDTDPRVRLIDFGIAGIKDSVFSQTEQSTRIAGTYRYMPPEQMEGRVCQESDVYAFGAIAYELLTGQPPVKSPLELIAIKIDGLKVKPRDLRPELPIAAQNVILKALSFETSDRYSNAREMGDLLADVLQGIEARGTAPTTEATRATVPANDRLEIAHVLFLDVVGFSALTMEDQRALLDTLQTLVRGTPHFARRWHGAGLLRQSDYRRRVRAGNCARGAIESRDAAPDRPALRPRLSRRRHQQEPERHRRRHQHGAARDGRRRRWSHPGLRRARRDACAIRRLEAAFERLGRAYRQARRHDALLQPLHGRRREPRLARQMEAGGNEAHEIAHRPDHRSARSRARRGRRHLLRDTSGSHREEGRSSDSAASGVGSRGFLSGLQG